jgi:putative methyltransferase (TIGR04325 family)
MELTKKVVLSLIPPILLPSLRRFFKIGIWYEGGFDTWDSANAASIGYESDEIVSKVLEGSLLARDEGLHERDGFILDSPDFNPYTWIGIIQALNIIERRGEERRKIRIVDFGGSFGSTYRMMKVQLHNSKIDFEWVVIEQKHFVDLGKQHFETDELRFVDGFSSLEDESIDILIFNGVLEYLENPYQVIKDGLSYSPLVILVDRTPINSKLDDTFSVQHVPKSIYKASYANRNFSKKNLLKLFESDYSMFLEYECALQPDKLNTSMGFNFIRNNE